MAIRMRIAHLQAEFETDSPADVRALVDAVFGLVGNGVAGLLPPAAPAVTHDQPEIVVEPDRRRGRGRRRKDVSLKGNTFKNNTASIRRTRRPTVSRTRASRPAPADGQAPAFGDIATKITTLLASGPQPGNAIADAIKEPIGKVRATLERLSKTGLVHRVGKARHTTWHLGSAHRGHAGRNATPRESASPATEGD